MKSALFYSPSVAYHTGMHKITDSQKRDCGHDEDGDDEEGEVVSSQCLLAEP